MSILILKPVITEDEKNIFIEEIQKAFQLSFEAKYGVYEDIILPEKDIHDAFNADGSEIYFAMIDEKIVGGTVINIDKETKRNHLDFLYVKVGGQSKGTGQAIWKAIEALHPETEIWETYTPYFDKRNIHFYVNRLGFHIVEFFNKHHIDPQLHGGPAGGMPDESGYDFFRFEKVMK